MNLAIFDIDGTLAESVAVDEVCYVQAFRDVLGIERINTNWQEYHYSTDSGLALEIYRNHLSRNPTGDEIRAVQSRFIELLTAALEKKREAIREVPGAAALLRWLGENPQWGVAIATGGWSISARFKLAQAGLPVATFPWANADDALERRDILRTAIQRAREHFHKDTFEQVVYVGDAVWDVRAAKSLGIGFLGRAAGDQAKKLKEEGAAWVLPDFSDPVQVWKSLAAAAQITGWL